MCDKYNFDPLTSGDIADGFIEFEYLDEENIDYPGDLKKARLEQSKDSIASEDHEALDDSTEKPSNRQSEDITANEDVGTSHQEASNYQSEHLIANQDLHDSDEETSNKHSKALIADSDDSDEEASNGALGNLLKSWNIYEAFEILQCKSDSIL